MKQILVVDDHRLMRKFLSEHLQKRGHRVATANDGLSAMRLLEEQTPDIAFIDLVMPNISGEKLCKIMRNRQELNRTFIVVLSATVVEEEISVADYSADLLLAKGPLNKLAGHIDFILRHVEQNCEERIKGKVLGQEEMFEREITKELLGAKRHFESIIGHMTEGLLEVVEDDKIIYVNPAAVAITGIPEKALLSSDFSPLFQKEDQHLIRRHLDAAAKSQKEYAIDHCFTLNQKQILLKIIPISHLTKLMSLVILAEDVTERNRAKAELLQQQSTLEQINSALLQRVQLERLTAEISSHLIGLHTQEIDEGIETALASIGTFTGADRAYLFMFRDDGKVIDNTHEWCDQGIESQKEKLQGIALDDELPWFAKQIRTHQVLHIKNVHELPEEAEASKELLKIQRILSLLIVPMVSAGRLIGFLGFDAVRKQRIWTMDDRSVLCIVGESFAHLLERRRTEKALRDSENKLRCLSDQLIRAQEKERNRIAAELHDELGQSLMALKLKLRFRFNALEEEESVKDSLLEVLRDIDEIADKTRRISGELRPAILEDLGLFAALKKLAEDTMGHSDARIYVDIADIRGAVTYEQELLLFRIFQEALTNALKHARPSRVWFTIQAEDDMLYCSIADNGEGRLEWEGNPSPRAAGGLGLSIMEERARMLEAKLDVQSGAGKGTRISFTVPLTRGAQ